MKNILFLIFLLFQLAICSSEFILEQSDDSATILFNIGEISFDSECRKY